MIKYIFIWFNLLINLHLKEIRELLNGYEIGRWILQPLDEAFNLELVRLEEELDALVEDHLARRQDPHLPRNLREPELALDAPDRQHRRAAELGWVEVRWLCRQYRRAASRQPALTDTYKSQKNIYLGSNLFGS